MARSPAAFVGVAAALAAAPPGLALALPQPVIAVRTTSPAEALVAPIDLSSGMPVLAVMVNGRGPLLIGLDTGAMGGLYLFGGGADRLGLTPSGELLATDPSGGEATRLNTYGRTEVSVGGRLFPSEVAGAPTPAPGRLSGLDGILGLEVFGPAIVTLDFASHQLSVDAPGLPPPDGRTVFSYGGTLPTVPLQVDGHQLQAYLDTGDVRASLVVPTALADQLPGRAGAQVAGMAHTINAARPLFRVSLAGPVRIGDVRLPVTEAQFPSLDAIGVLGAAALEGLVVRIDTLNRRVQVLAPGQAQTKG